MNSNRYHDSILTHTLAAGLLGFGLRWLLYRVGFDEKGILSSSHPLHLACLALTAGMGIYLYLVTRKEDAPRQDHALLRFAAGVLAGGLLCLYSLSLTGQLEGPLSVIRLALCFLSATAMILSGFPSLSRTPLENLCHGVICAGFALDMLCRYREWSGNPQLPDYCLHVLACTFLALESYQRLAFGVALAKRRALRFCGLMGLYLSLLCAAGPETKIFYLGGVFWAAACIWAPEPPAKAPGKEEASDAPA